MRLTFWTETVPPALSGISTFLSLLWESLRQEDFQLALVTRAEGLSGPAIPGFPPPPDWLPQLRLPFLSLLQRPEPQGWIRLKQRLLAFWQQHPPEVVHICSPGHPSLFFLLPLLGSTPLVLSLHDYHPELDYSGDTLPRRLLLRANRILCRSLDVADDLVRRCPSVESRIQVIRQGFTVAEESAVHPGDFSLLYAGRLAPEKGVDLLLKALPGVLAQRPQAHLSVAGDGPLRQQLQDLAQQLGLTDSVTWLGTLSPQELQQKMQQVSLLVVPSRREPLGLVALEAARVGLPVVAARVGGLQEIVDHQVTGWLVEPECPLELTTALLALLGDRPRCQHMGLAARRRIATHFSLEAMLAQHHQAYREVG